jgi:opacity protein-like surface antigen
MTSIGGGAETMITDNLSLGLEADYRLVNDVEAASTDLSDLFDDSEMIRVKAKLTWRQ